MRAEQRKLARLRRLEKVRSLAKQHAARQAAEAEGMLAQLNALAARTRSIADAYRNPAALPDGLALRQQSLFKQGLSGITAATLRDATTARAAADARQHELARAERSRAAVEERAGAVERALQQRKSSPASSTRKQLGTGLE